MVRRFLSLGLALAGLLLLTRPLADDPLRRDRNDWTRGPWPPFAKASSPAVDGTKDATPRVHRPVAGLALTPPPMQARGWQPVPLVWESNPSTLPSMADRVRDDIGADVTPTEFSDPGPVGTFLTWVGGEPLRLPPWFRASVKASSSSVGSGVDVNLFLRWDEWKFAVRVWNQNDGMTAFPGINVELFEFPLAAPRPILVTPRLSLWSQPVPTDSQGRTWAGLGSLVFEVPVEENLWFWWEGRVKSNGGTRTEELGAKLSVRTGLHWSPF